MDNEFSFHYSGEPIQEMTDVRLYVAGKYMPVSKVSVVTHENGEATLTVTVVEAVATSEPDDA